MERNQEIDKFMNAIRSMKDFGRVGFIVLYGSSAEKRAITGSDIDICVYYNGSKAEQLRFRQRLLERLPSNFDIQIFQQLPLYVRKEVLRGRDIYSRDKKFMYEIALQNIREYDSFKPHLMDYIEG